MMTKNWLTLVLLIGIVLSRSALESGDSRDLERSNQIETGSTETSRRNVEEKLSSELENKEETAMQMSVSANGNTIIYKLNNSQAAKDLYEQLPLSVEVETYANKEIIFYPPEKLDVSNTPLAKKGGAGTIAYYAPWGDVVMFYDSFSSASGLYKLGQIVSGSDSIKSMSGTISFTKINE